MGWSRFFHRGRWDDERARELDSYLQIETDENIARGMAPDEARSAAHRKLGNVTLIREEIYRMNSIGFLQTLRQDLGYGFRMLIRTPGFTVVVVLTLALGIGANTAIFSVVHAVLLKPLPFREPDRLMILSERSAQFNQMSVAYQNFVDWRDGNRSFSGMAAFRQTDLNLIEPEGARRLRGRMVSSGFFRLLGVTLALGREFSSEDDREGGARNVILSYALWQNIFGGDPGIIGKSIRLNDRDYTVIGVAARDLWFYSPADLYVPMSILEKLYRDSRETRAGTLVVARLKDGVNPGQAGEDMDVISRRLAAEYPQGNAGHSVNIDPMIDDVVGYVRPTLYLLLGAVGFVLLIACVNVANLLLARAATRWREMAIRGALGAGRSRLMRQLLTESVLMALFGGALGVGLAAWGTGPLLAAVPGSLPRADSIEMNAGVLLFTLSVSLLTGLLFGLAPAIRSVRPQLHSSLREGARGTTGRSRLQDMLVAAELALALMLLVGAGLILRTLQQLYAVDPGFRPDNVLTFNVSLSPGGYSRMPKVRAFYQELLQRLQALPGVEKAAFSSDLPVVDDSEVMFYVQGRPKPTPENLSWAMFYLVSPDYIDTMGIRLLQGRFFNDHDTPGAPLVVVIDDVMAHALFPGQNPVGEHLIIPFQGLDQPREIVGVVQHASHWGLSQDPQAKIRSQFYMPLQIPDELVANSSAPDLSFLLRTHADPRTMTESVKRTVHSIDSTVAVYGFGTMSEILRTSIDAQRFTGRILGLFAALALLLASVGIYAVTSYAVSLRTQEVGVRMALGARPRDVLRLVLRHSGVVAACGLALGLAGSLGISRLLSRWLFGVKATDPLTFLTVSFLLVAVALTASFVPAWRAAKVDPMNALHHE